MTGEALLADLEVGKRLAGGAAAVDDKLALERRISLLLDENAQLKLQAGIGDDERGRYERRIAATEDLLSMQLAPKMLSNTVAMRHRKITK